MVSNTLKVKIVLSVLISITTVSMAKQQFWKDAEKGYVYGIGHYKDTNLNVRNENGQTPLMIAVKNGHTNTVRGFSEGIVDISIEDYEGKMAYDYITPFTSRENQFLYKRMYGALRTLEVAQIVRTKAKIVQYSYLFDTDTLQITIKGKGVDCDSFLFPKNTECQAIKVKTTPDHEIFQAIKDHNDTLVDTLLPTVDIDTKDKRNYSLLWRAIISKNLYAVDKVLQNNADINQSDPNDLHTPIRWTVIQNDVGLLKILIKRGVDVNSKDKFGNFALYHAMFKCNNFEAITILLDNGANPYLKDKYGKTVFDEKPAFCKDPTDVKKMKMLLKERSAFSR